MRYHEPNRNIVLHISGFPHYSAHDDVYRGFHLPAGTIVVANIWLVVYNAIVVITKRLTALPLPYRAMCHDETEFPSPNTFNPDRFLNPDGTLNSNVRDPENLVFGFGRRVCPGKWFALESVWIAIARVLSVYEIGEPTHLDGSVPRSEGEFASGLIR